MTLVVNDLQSMLDEMAGEGVGFAKASGVPDIDIMSLIGAKTADAGGYHPSAIERHAIGSASTHAEDIAAVRDQRQTS